MAAFVEKKFVDHDNFKVWNGEFEQYPHEKDSFDLVYSATAFHWIPDEIGYTKVMDMLKPGGTLAIFWNQVFIGDENDPLHQKIRSIRLQYAAMGHIAPEPKNKDQERYENRVNGMKAYNFEEVELKLHKQTRSFSADAFIALLSTYSDHNVMEASVRDVFYEEIRAAINDFGGIIQQYDIMDLYLGRKPV